MKQELTQCIILSAGLGKRLFPITQHTPKPIISVCNHTPLELIIGQVLSFFPIKQFYVNYHHLPHKMFHFLSHLQPKYPLISTYENQIRDTGGGIANFKDFISSHFIVHNCDIISDIDLKSAFEKHLSEKNLITWILIDYKEKNNVQIKNNSIIGISNQFEDNLKCFSGIAFYSQKIFNYFPKTHSFPIQTVLNRAIQAKEKISYYLSTKHTFWFDIGTMDQYFKIHKYFREKEEILTQKNQPLLSAIPPNISIRNNVWINRQIKFSTEKKINLHNCIIWPENWIDCNITNSIIGVNRSFIIEQGKN